jgi:hypothetical protein
MEMTMKTILKKLFVFYVILNCIIPQGILFAQTQNNSSGSNTAITGGYTSSTTYESGSTSSSTTTSNSTSNMRSAPNQSFAPSFSSSGPDTCTLGVSAGVQTFSLGISAGSNIRDENCEKIKLSRQLDTMGMKVAAVALLCQDERVFFAMEQAGTPCPFEGKIGKEANDLWKKYDLLRPDYNLYVSKLKVIADKKKEDDLKFAEEMEKAKVK